MHKTQKYPLEKYYMKENAVECIGGPEWTKNRLSNVKYMKRTVTLSSTNSATSILTNCISSQIYVSRCFSTLRIHQFLCYWKLILLGEIRWKSWSINTKGMKLKIIFIPLKIPFPLCNFCHRATVWEKKTTSPTCRKRLTRHFVIRRFSISPQGELLGYGKLFHFYPQKIHHSK